MKSGLYGWINRNMKGRKGQQGFTLIELLVVVTILGVLAAIVTLSLVGLTTNANTQSCNAEYRTVQSALDAYMANNQLPSVAAQTAVTNDMAGTAIPATAAPNTNNGTVKLYVGAPTATNPNYTRNATTQFYYTWDTSGRINAIWSNAAGTATVANCTIR